MAGWLRGKEPPKVQDPPPPPPTVDEATERVRSKDETRRRKGHAASVLTSPEGVSESPVRIKTLLGA
jgi:hypothetical protein